MIPSRSPCEIRRLIESDVPAVLRVIHDVRRAYGLAARVEAIIEPSDRVLFATYQRARSAYFVALDGVTAVGGAGIAPLVGADDETCELQRMYLDPRYRRRGVGKRLLDELVGMAKSFGYRRCYAETVAAMQEAISLYKADGFRLLFAPVGNTGHAYNDCWMLRVLTSDATTIAT